MPRSLVAPLIVVALAGCGGPASPAPAAAPTTDEERPAPRAGPAPLGLPAHPPATASAALRAGVERAIELEGATWDRNVTAGASDEVRARAFARWARERRDALTALEESLRPVAGRPHLERAVAAAALGVAWARFAAEVASAPIPSTIASDERLRTMFVDALRSSTEPMLVVAAERFDACVAAASHVEASAEAWTSFCRERAEATRATVDDVRARASRQRPPPPPDPGPAPGGPAECWEPPSHASWSEPTSGEPRVAVVLGEVTTAPLLDRELEELRDAVHAWLVAASVATVPLDDVRRTEELRARGRLGLRECESPPSMLDALRARHGAGVVLARVVPRCDAECRTAVQLEPTARGLPQILPAPVAEPLTDVSSWIAAMPTLRPPATPVGIVGALRAAPRGLGPGSRGGGLEVLMEMSRIGDPPGREPAVEVSVTHAFGVDPDVATEILDAARDRLGACATEDWWRPTDVVMDVLSDGPITEIDVRAIDGLPDPRAACVRDALTPARMPGGSGVRRIAATVRFGNGETPNTARTMAYGAVDADTGLRVRTAVTRTDDGGLARALFETRAGPLRRAVAACHAEAFGRDARPVVATRLSLRVDGRGRTPRADVDLLAAPGGPPSRAFERCLRERARDLAWPCSASPRGAEVEVLLCASRDPEAQGGHRPP